MEVDDETPSAGPKENGILPAPDLLQKTDQASKSFLNQPTVTQTPPSAETQMVNGVHEPPPIPATGLLQSFEAPKAVIEVKDEYAFGGIVNRETDIQVLAWQENILKSHLKSVSEVSEILSLILLGL